MIEFKTLLPPNATSTERKLERAMAFDQPLWELSGKLHQLRKRRPTPFNQWLAGEWGIADFRRFFADESQFYAAMLPWLRCRGSAVATQTALYHVGADNAVLDVEHFRLHIHLATPWVGDLNDFKFAVNESIPLHLQFYRLTSGCDVRHGDYDGSYYDNCLYDDDSGVWQNGIKINYCTENTFKISALRIRARTTLTNHQPNFIGRTWARTEHWKHEPWGTGLQCTHSVDTADVMPLTTAFVENHTAQTGEVLSAPTQLIESQTRQNIDALDVATGEVTGLLTTTGPLGERDWENVEQWKPQPWQLNLPNLGTTTI
ncbi:MAG: hypothetical protein CR975_02105 [Gammaproteobacteria bacterium]|nr:MAG: hypothetical protein CR975_02105 [Gammaproteobacteria bacterium]